MMFKNKNYIKTKDCDFKRGRILIKTYKKNESVHKNVEYLQLTYKNSL